MQQELESGEIAPGALSQANHVATSFPLWLGTILLCRMVCWNRDSNPASQNPKQSDLLATLHM